MRGLRSANDLTLDALAERSGVSRAMISRIERSESSPTAQVIARLASGLGVTVASLFADEESQDAAPLARLADQRAWRDPETGYQRRNLSPPGYPSAIELVEVTLPPGARVAYDTALRAPAIDQQVYVLEGAVEISLGKSRYELGPGDCLAMRVDQVAAFRNPAARAARYIVALAAATARSAAGGRS